MHRIGVRPTTTFKVPPLANLAEEDAAARLLWAALAGHVTRRRLLRLRECLGAFVRGAAARRRATAWVWLPEK